MPFQSSEYELLGDGNENAKEETNVKHTTNTELRALGHHMGVKEREGEDPGVSEEKVSEKNSMWELHTQGL